MKKIVAGVAIWASTCDFHAFQQPDPGYNEPSALVCEGSWPVPISFRRFGTMAKCGRIGDGFHSEMDSPGIARPLDTMA